jgi:XTP/dITP diphosphohydrolase
MAALIVSTRNEHKLRELREALPGIDLAPLPEEVELPPEDGESFEENALIKARAARAATGGAALADDSGIEAAALGGRPGIFSARYAGENASDEENLAKLLEEVGRGSDRRVAYVCALAYIDPDGEERTFEGRCEGELVGTPRGGGGFGYDPAFLPADTGPGDERTMAELGAEEKHAISHRGRAARRLAEHLGPRR